MPSASEPRAHGARSILEVLGVATRLGLTSFGGPVAHLGYFRGEYVPRRRWVDERSYADLVALCQFLPGPASSQLGIAIGMLRAGLLGGVAAWLGFTLPSALALVAFAYGVRAAGVGDAGWLHGLKVVAVAVVAQAVWGMARTLAPDRPRATIAILAAIAVIASPTVATQVLIIAAVVGLLLVALYLPVWTSAVTGPADVALALAAFGLLAFWRWPPWLVVVFAAAGGAALAVF